MAVGRFTSRQSHRAIATGTRHGDRRERFSDDQPHGEYHVHPALPVDQREPRQQGESEDLAPHTTTEQLIAARQSVPSERSLNTSGTFAAAQREERRYRQGMTVR